MAIRLVLALLLFLAATSLVPAQSGDGPYVIRDVRVFDGETVAERQTVVIREGRIAEIGGSTIAAPPGAQEVAGEGRTLLPGLMDAHVHLPLFSPAEALRQTLALGVTTATSATARAFRMSDRGQIRTGMRADLLLVDGDPSTDIRTTRNIVAIWKRGVRVQRASS